MKTGALAGWALYGNAPTVLLDDSASDGQSQSRSVRFGGEKWLEQAGNILRRYARTTILDGNVNAASGTGPRWRRFRNFRGDTQRTSLSHCVHSIEKQIHERLLQGIFRPQKGQGRLV